MLATKMLLSHGTFAMAVRETADERASTAINPPLAPPDRLISKKKMRRRKRRRKSDCQIQCRSGRSWQHRGISSSRQKYYFARGVAPERARPDLSQCSTKSFNAKHPLSTRCCHDCLPSGIKCASGSMWAGQLDDPAKFPTNRVQPLQNPRSFGNLSPSNEHDEVVRQSSALSIPERAGARIGNFIQQHTRSNA